MTRLAPQEMHVYDALEKLAPCAKSYLGIGVQEGVCVGRVVAANPDMESLVLCDTWGLHHGGTGRGNHAHIEEMLARAGYRGRVRFLDGLSQSLVPTLSESFDLSYVDGDHSEELALQDLRNAWERTRLAMVVHDTSMPPVAAALKRFMANCAGVTVDLSGWTGTTVVYR
jgi:hypothetical protein